MTHQSPHDKAADAVHEGRPVEAQYVRGGRGGVRILTLLLVSLAAVAIPYIEVHLSNPHAREPFRHTSYFSDLAVGVVSGFGPLSYGLGLAAAIRQLDDRTP